MKHWIGLAVGAALFSSVAGCAGSRPCLVIPAQIELAGRTRDQMREAMQTKEAEVQRTKDNLKVSKDRLDQLSQDRDDLKGLIESQLESQQAPRGGAKP